VTSSTKERSPATDSDAVSPGSLDCLVAGDPARNQAPVSRVCELCDPVLGPPPPYPLVRVTVLLCGRHNHALNDIGLTPAERTRVRMERFYTDRDRAARGVTDQAHTWLARRQPNPLYWVTVDAETYRALHGTAVNTR
jgi:hypothetical protein